MSDIADATDSIAMFIAGVQRDHFLGDELLQSGVLHKLQVIGEAARRIPESVRGLAPHVPWREFVAFRNFSIRADFAVDWEVVWTTAVDDAPIIAEALRELLAHLPETDDAAKRADHERCVAT